LLLWALAGGASAAGKIGPRVLVGTGEDPDIAAGPGGTVHLVYTRSKAVYHRSMGPGGKFSAEVFVANGVDPRLAVGAAGQVHVALVSSMSGGSVRYVLRKKGSFSAPKQLSKSPACRKPRIALAPSGEALVSFEDKGQQKRVRYVRIAPDGKVSPQTVVGDDNNGGLAVDAAGLVHVTWRSKVIYYNTSAGTGKAGASLQISPKASDFSELALRASDKSVHVVGEVANAGGIFYIARVGGAWKSPQILAKSLVAGQEPDDVNPAIAVGSKGRCYVTFNGKAHVPYYFIVDAKGKAGPAARLDPGGAVSAGKYKNPNLTPAAGGGVRAAWGSAGQKVYLRSITVQPMPPKPDGGTADGPRDLGGGPSAERHPRDTGLDAGLPPADKGPVIEEPINGGCSCRTEPGPGRGWALLLVALAAILGRKKWGQRANRPRPTS